MTPSPLKEQSKMLSNQVGPPRSSPRTRLAQAMSSPYTPKVRSKLSQCISLENESSPLEGQQERDDPLTQSDVSLSQNTMLSSQEPCISQELFNFKSKPPALEFEKEDNESIRNEHGNEYSAQLIEDDLMDEQLSIGDASFSQENSPVLEVFQLNSIY